MRRLIHGISLFFFTLPLFALFCSSCASRRTVSAEELFSLGMAYFELGRAATDNNIRLKYFLEAEKWLNQARMTDKTKSASVYNLGRIAFETGRYQDAAKHFESILKRDPDNILALKAASYTRIKTGDIDKAEAHYQKLLTLVPESADSGYNYALVLFHMKKYEAAEKVLSGYQFSLLDNADCLLLYARTQRALDKIEAAETYAKWLANNKDPKVRCEYAGVLESHEFYARALEEYRSALGELKDDSKDPPKSDVRFFIARLLLIADSTSEEGIKELETAVKDGFANIDELEKLAEDKRPSAASVNSIKAIISEIRQKQVPAAPANEEMNTKPETENESAE